MKNTVLVPLYKWPLSQSEALCLDKVLLFFSDNDIFFFGPEKVRKSIPLSLRRKIGFIDFQDFYFKSIKSYSNLLSKKFFYEKFAEYSYLLIVQLDCLVLRDELTYWACKNYSYIGAPWFAGYHQAESNPELLGVGNGGFSIRRTKDFIKALDSILYLPWKPQYHGYSKHTSLREIILDEYVFAYNRTPFLPRVNEDFFWGYLIAHRCEWFTVPSSEEALAFSFEVNPSLMYELSGKHLPFGCHAWQKYDEQFWKDLLGESFFELSSEAECWLV